MVLKIIKGCSIKNRVFFVRTAPNYYYIPLGNFFQLTANRILICDGCYDGGTYVRDLLYK